MALDRLWHVPCSRIKGLDLHPLQPHLLATDMEGAVWAYDYQARKAVAAYTHTGPPVRPLQVRAVSHHPHAPVLATGADDRLVRLYHCDAAGRAHATHCLPGHRDYIRAVQFCPGPLGSPGFHWLASASDDRTFRVWDWGARVCLRTVRDHSDWVMGVRWHPDPRQCRLVTASLDTTVRVWDCAGLAAGAAVPLDECGYGDNSVDENGKEAGARGFIPPKYLDPSNRKKLLPGVPVGESDEPDQTYGEALPVIAVLEGHEQGATHAQWHPTRPGVLLTCAGDGSFRVWQCGAGAGAGAGAGDDAPTSFTLWGHTEGCAWSAVLSDDIVATGGLDGTLCVWDIVRRHLLATRRDGAAPPPRLWAATWRAAEGLLVVGSDTGLTAFAVDLAKAPAGPQLDEKSLLRLTDASATSGTRLARGAAALRCDVTVYYAAIGVCVLALMATSLVCDVLPPIRWQVHAPFALATCCLGVAHAAWGTMLGALAWAVVTLCGVPVDWDPTSVALFRLGVVGAWLVMTCPLAPRMYLDGRLRRLRKRRRRVLCALGSGTVAAEDATVLQDPCGGAEGRVARGARTEAV